MTGLRAKLPAEADIAGAAGGRGRLGAADSGIGMGLALVVVAELAAVGAGEQHMGLARDCKVA